MNSESIDFRSTLSFEGRKEKKSCFAILHIVASLLGQTKPGFQRWQANLFGTHRGVWSKRKQIYLLEVGQTVTVRCSACRRNGQVL